MPVHVTVSHVVIIKEGALCGGKRDSLGALFEHKTIIDGQALITLDDGTAQVLPYVDDSILNGHQSFEQRVWN